MEVDSHGRIWNTNGRGLEINEVVEEVGEREVKKDPTQHFGGREGLGEW